MRQDKPRFPCRRLDARLRGHDQRGVIPAKAGIQHTALEHNLDCQNSLSWRLCRNALALDAARTYPDRFAVMGRGVCAWLGWPL